MLILVISSGPNWGRLGTLLDAFGSLLGGFVSENSERELTKPPIKHLLTSLSSLIHPLTHSLTHSLPHFLTHSLTHSLIHSFTHWLTDRLTDRLSDGD